MSRSRAWRRGMKALMSSSKISRRRMSKDGRILSTCLRKNRKESYLRRHQNRERMRWLCLKSSDEGKISRDTIKRWKNRKERRQSSWDREILYLIWMMRPLLVSLNINHLAQSASSHRQRMKFLTRTTSLSYLLTQIQSRMLQHLTELMLVVFCFSLVTEMVLSATLWVKEKIMKQLLKLPSRNWDRT